MLFSPVTRLARARSRVLSVCGNFFCQYFQRDFAKDRYRCQISVMEASNGMNSDAPSNKIRKQVPKIGTHNGVFHCDDALACFLLKLLPEFKDAEIVRSRDESVLKTCDIVVDVGSVFDPNKKLFDHHQRDFKETMKNVQPNKPWDIKLSSAGLVYAFYGDKVISEILKLSPEDDRLVPIYDKVYENFVMEIDAIDNGVSMFDGSPRYRISSHISARVGRLNPDWNSADRDHDSRFEEAMKLVGDEFLYQVNYYYNVWWPARKLVVEMLEKRLQVHESGQILELTEGGCPWKDHLFTLEKTHEIEKPILFVIFTDTAGKWRVQAVPEEIGSFNLRVPLLEEWRGLRDSELSELSGIPGCVFVHHSGFIGGHQTREGALEMAIRTMKRSVA